MRHNSEDTRESEEKGRGSVPDAEADSFPAHGEVHGSVVCLTIVYGGSLLGKYLPAAHRGSHGFLAGPVTPGGTQAGAVH